MGENNKNYDVRRKTASAMAVLLAVMAPGVFPAGAAMAESAGRLVPEREGETVWASGSDAGHGGREWREKQGAEEHRTGEGKKSGDAQEYDQMHDEEDDEEADEIELEDDWLARLKHALWFEVATSSDAQLQDETELLPGTRLWGQTATSSDVQLQDQPATPSDLTLFAQISLTGDLWTDWNGNANFPGEGTKEAPYQIENLSHLMGLSEAVAAGEDFADCYFELTQSLDLGGISINRGSWNPIGWYWNAADMNGEVQTPFRGHFDGCGNTITGLKIIGELDGKKNLGLFGVIDGGSVENLEIRGDQIRGADQAGILAGTLKNGAVVRNVTVSGYVYSERDAGGIAAVISGSGKGTASGTQIQEADGSVIVENCRAEGIAINAVTANGAKASGAVGGIAGRVEKAYLIDNVVITQNGDSDRVQGKGYVGGIAGSMSLSGIYNSYVNGTIGGNASLAVGGIVGKYESGNLILARMAGTISRTNAGSASREGTFVGTRDSSARFTYGTERDSRISYLFTNTLAKAKQVFGSTIDGDNRFAEDAHIGYWSDLERKYKTVSGQIEYDCGDRFFYEELEDGVRYIVTQKLGREFTMEGYKKDLPFAMDHFAPGFMGEPARGYLVYIPRIDARNANGTYDTDVAALSAISSTGSSYYRDIDKDHPSAIKAGAVVTVATAPKNTAENRYQMIVDLNEAGGVKPPTYLDENEDEQPMQYVGGGAYSFLMPECDTQLNAEYVKVTTRLTADPEETRISVVQTRSGDRKHPQIVTEVKNTDGVLIARYVDGVQDHSVEVQPVLIHVEHNGNGQTVDRTVRWLVDDTDLLENRSETGYTMKDASVMPNMNSAFITNIINREVQAQAANQYREKIRDTVYTRYGVVSAVTNPETSVNHQALYANCRVAVDFQIVDLTTVRVETLSLNQTEAHFTVTRKLTGSCYQPSESITVSEPVVLTASLNPEHPFYEQVSWKDTESGKNVRLEVSGANQQNCKVMPVWDPKGENNPAWIQNLIHRDRTLKREKPLEKVNGNGIREEIVTAVSEDQTHGHIQAQCRVRIQFVTVDETVPRVFSGGSGGSGGGGGGSKGSGGSTGITSGGVIKAAGPSMPSYVVTGTWMQNAAGQWMFADKERTYAKEWAAVHNPYASTAAGQSAYDWFRFDEAGFLVTGWYQDTDGNQYYLNPSSDGTQGRMLTGWNWVGGQCLYFEEESNGSRGALKKNYTAPDGKQTNEQGAWVVNGVVQRQEKTEGAQVQKEASKG